MAIYCQLVTLLSCISLLVPLAKAFNFITGNPTQCDNLSVSWTGGTPPFQLLVVPVFGTPRNLTIPSSAFSNNQGSYQFQLPLEEGERFVISMSDASGFGTGGSTDLMTVGSSLGGSCNSTNPNVAFSFELDSALQQCGPYLIDGYDTAVQPVTIMAIIPAGESTVLRPAIGTTSFTWITDVAAGTSMIFMMVDAQGRQGGSSDVKIVGITDDTTCLNSQSPSSTVSSSSPSSSTSPSTASSTSLIAPSPSSSSTSASITSAIINPSVTSSSPASRVASIGAVAGTVIGALMFLAMVITVALFFFKKKKDVGGNDSRNHRLQSDLDLTLGSSRLTQFRSNSEYSHSTVALTPSSHPFTPGYDGNNPFSDASSTNLHMGPPYQQTHQMKPDTSARYFYPSSYNNAHSQPQHHDLQQDPFNPSAVLDPFGVATPATSSNGSIPAQHKGTLAGVADYKPSRFILHTDVEDVIPLSSEGDIVELPPQYTERRQPPPLPVVSSRSSPPQLPQTLNLPSIFPEHSHPFLELQ